MCWPSVGGGHRRVVSMLLYRTAGPVEGRRLFKWQRNQRFCAQLNRKNGSKELLLLHWLHLGKCKRYSCWRITSYEPPESNPDLFLKVTFCFDMYVGYCLTTHPLSESCRQLGGPSLVSVRCVAPVTGGTWCFEKGLLVCSIVTVISTDLWSRILSLLALLFSQIHPFI